MFLLSCLFSISFGRATRLLTCPISRPVYPREVLIDVFSPLFPTVNLVGLRLRAYTSFAVMSPARPLLFLSVFSPHGAIVVTFAS